MVGVPNMLGAEMTGVHAASWGIAALATAGVILRPWKLPEFVWALGGAVALVAFGLLPVKEAWSGIAKGGDVYLFLTGMMLLAELARSQGLFDWLAGKAALLAKGSASRLFDLVYLVGTIVTIFLSNDATAVVLTPAIAAIARTVKAEKPLPYLFICAFIANAASFVLPISNPANLVIYGSHMPSLLQWLPRYALPSLVSIAITYIVLRLTQRRDLKQEISTDIPQTALSIAGKITAFGIIATAIVLMVASALDVQLGLPTFIAGALTAAIILIAERETPWKIMREISWGVLPLVAGLFVLVEALNYTGVIALISEQFRAAAHGSTTQAVLGMGSILAVASNLINNLPAGLIAGTAVQSAHADPTLTGAVLIGVDLGPNLSVTGSLATILWLTALRREELTVGAWSFLKLGLLVMPPALISALGCLLVTG